MLLIGTSKNKFYVKKLLAHVIILNICLINVSFMKCKLHSSSSHET